MAHFAQIDENNTVIQVIVVDNSILIDQDGIEKEELGIEFCKKILGQETRWVQTSYNRSFRKNFAGMGYKYDDSRDAFIEPKPHESAVLNEDGSWFIDIGDL